MQKNCGCEHFQENGWSQAFTDRVILEYRKFAYLACVSSSAVTPSDEVDQAWHLHLAYTGEYWNSFCNGVLRQDLHHKPTEGASEEDEKYRGQYIQTLRLYFAEFDAVPAADIWPLPEKRFSAPRYMRRVDTAANWVIRKSTKARAVLVACAIVLAIIGCFAGFKIIALGDSEHILMFLLIAVVGFGFATAIVNRAGTKVGVQGGGCGGCGGCGG